MSNDSGLKIWVSDLDDYIDIDAIDRANKQEAEELSLQAELDEIGDIPLLSGKAISAHTLSSKGIFPSEWRWAKHQAERALHEHQQWADIEGSFVKELLALGKHYAISRYSKWEGVSYPAALTATFPHGFRALLDQFLKGERIAGTAEQTSFIQSIVRRASGTSDLTAYRRAGMIRSAIHQIAYETFGPLGHLQLNKESMRSILSLARLHYTVAEMNVGSFREIGALYQLYEVARLQAQRGVDRHQPILGRHIQNWELRHLHPFTHLYPYSIRNALTRALQHHQVTPDNPTRAVAINELALSRCSVLLMRQKAKSR